MILSMEPAPSQLTGEHVSFATSTVVLWMITVYGVLLIVSVFAACVHSRQRTPFGARCLRRLALGNAAASVVAPVLCTLLGESNIGVAVGGAWLALAAGCLAVSKLRLSESPEPVPRARVIDMNH